MKLQRIAITLLVVLLMFGCQGPNTENTTETAADANAQAEPLVVGMEVNYAPFNWMQTESGGGAIEIDGVPGYAAGYDVEIAKLIAEALGRPLVIKQIAWEGLIPAVESGAIDLIIAGMSVDEERLQSVNFTEPYYQSSYVMLVKADGDYVNATSLADFAGANIVGQKSTNYDVIIDQIEGVNHLTPLNSVPLIINAIMNDAADGSPVEEPVGVSVVAANPQIHMVTFEPDKGFQESPEITTAVSVALKKGDDEFTEQLNQILQGIDEATRKSLMETALENQPSEN